MDSSGLNKNVLHGLRYLNPWSPLGGAVWGGLGGAESVTLGGKLGDEKPFVISSLIFFCFVLMIQNVSS